MLELALRFAEERHAGQFDKAGQPYFLHILAVVANVVALGGDEEQQCAAALHDVVEDEHATHEEVRGLFGCGVATLVEMMDKTGKTNEEYYAVLRANPRGALVKVGDLQHNSLDSRLTDAGLVLTEKDRLRTSEYAEKIKFLGY